MGSPGARLCCGAARELNDRPQPRNCADRHAETAEGIDNAAAIAPCPDRCAADRVGDLTTDYGIPGQSTTPGCAPPMSEVADACRTHARAGVGGIRHNVAPAGELIRLGARS